MKHRDPSRLRAVADAYASKLRALFGQRVFGPEEPVVGRIQGLYIPQNHAQDRSQCIHVENQGTTQTYIH